MLLASASFNDVNAREKLTADVPHSHISFKLPFLKYASQGGVFPDFTLEFTKGNKDFSGSTVVFSADVNALNTNEPERDAHLKQAPFFNTAQYPFLTFTSTAFDAVKTNEFSMKGNLTIKGITKPAAFHVIFKGEAQDPMTQEHLYIFAIAGTVNRFDFGVGTEFPDFVIGDKIFLEASVILKREEASQPEK